MSQEYKISTVADFLQVPSDKREECLIDFLQWLQLADNPELIESFAQMTGVKAEFLTSEFHWFDDGLRGVSEIVITEKAAT